MANRSDAVKDPTLYPDVNAILAFVLADVQATLQEHMVGFYVHGSLAMGDFQSARSDIDFVVVTDGGLPGEMLPRLAAMHKHITASGLKWAKKLEGSYIPVVALRRFDPANSQYPALRVDGSFDVDGHGSDWIIQRWVLREHGITLTGPAIKTLIDPVAPEDLRRAALGTLLEWWQPHLTDQSYLATTEYQAYAALTMCRALYTLTHREVTSKSRAAHWAEQALDERWQPLIALALRWPEGDQPDRLAETIEFVRYTIERGKEISGDQRSSSWSSFR